MAAGPKIPVTVVTGFLGAGKTTLVNNILKGNHGKRVAVIENEYGEVGIDDALVVDTKEEIFEMNNGCICCTVRGDLVRTLNKLLRRKKRFDAILIETTGLADPAPVAQTFFADQDLKDALSLDAIVTVVDAKHALQHLREVKPEGIVNEAVQQVAFADRVLLNKVDLAGPEERREVVAAIRSINRAVEIIECVNSQVDLEKILGLAAFDVAKMLEQDPEFLDLDAADRKHREEDSHKHGHGHGHGHEHTHKDDGHDHADCEACGHDHAHGHKHTHEDDGHDHADCEACGHDHAHGHKHTHDTRVSSVGIVCDGSVDLQRVNVWLGTLLQSRGADLYRTKGILSVEGMDDRLVFHGVHMMLQMGSSAEHGGRPWGPDEKRQCRLVFIGKDLDRKLLNDGFRRCLVGTAAEKSE